MTQYYTGVGSRNVPDDVRIKLAQYAVWLYSQGMICRTGDADGCDAVFRKHSKRCIAYSPKDVINDQNHWS